MKSTRVTNPELKGAFTGRGLKASSLDDPPLRNMRYDIWAAFFLKREGKLSTHCGKASLPLTTVGTKLTLLQYNKLGINYKDLLKVNYITQKHLCYIIYNTYIIALSRNICK